MDINARRITNIVTQENLSDDLEGMVDKYGLAFVTGALAFSVLGLLWMAGGPAAAVAVMGLLAVGAVAVGAAILSGFGGQPFGR